MSEAPPQVSRGSSFVLLLSGSVLFAAGIFLWFAAEGAGVDPVTRRGTLRTIHELGDWVVWFLVSCGAGGIFYGGRGLFLGR
jgi:hypothetical protein